MEPLLWSSSTRRLVSLQGQSSWSHLVLQLSQLHGRVVHTQLPRHHRELPRCSGKDLPFPNTPKQKFLQLKIFKWNEFVYFQIAHKIWMLVARSTSALVNPNYKKRISLHWHEVCHSQDDRWLLVTPLLHRAQALQSGTAWQLFRGSSRHFNRSHPPQLNIIKALLSVGFLQLVHARSTTLLTAANAKEESKWHKRHS